MASSSIRCESIVHCTDLIFILPFATLSRIFFLSSTCLPKQGEISPGWSFNILADIVVK